MVGVSPTTMGFSLLKNHPPFWGDFEAFLQFLLVRFQEVARFVRIRASVDP